MQLSVGVWNKLIWKVLANASSDGFDLSEFKEASRFTKDIVLPENALKPHVTEIVKTEVACLEEELLEPSKMCGGKRPFRDFNQFTMSLPENAPKPEAVMNEKIKTELI